MPLASHRPADTATQPPDWRSRLISLPKAELRRRLEGAVRPATAAELTRQSHPSAADLQAALRTPEALRRVAREAVLGAAGEGIRYLELHLAPSRLAGDLGEAGVLDAVLEAVAEAGQEAEVRVGLVVSLFRQDPLPQAERVAAAALARREAGVVGLSLVGDEARHRGEHLRPLLAEARREGLGLTVQAGLWAGAQEVAYALEDLQADRIAHGLRVLEDPGVVRLARERAVVFEVCPSSNLASGVVPSWEAHPLPTMIQAGLRVTLNTENPAVLGIGLSEELARAVDGFDLSLETVVGLTMTAVQGAFLPGKEKRALEREFQRRLPGIA